MGRYYSRRIPGAYARADLQRQSRRRRSEGKRL